MISLGQLWQKDTKGWLSSSTWPEELASHPQDPHWDEADESTLDLEDFSPTPDTVFELDDRHVTFLEEQEKVEEGEVERIVSLVDQVDPMKLIGRHVAND
jgi:hypothetical protein